MLPEAGGGEGGGSPPMFSVYVGRDKPRLIEYVPERYSEQDVVSALDRGRQTLTDLQLLGTCEEMVEQAALKLEQWNRDSNISNAIAADGALDTEIQYVIDYAIAHNIELRFGANITFLSKQSLDRYLLYFNTRLRKDSQRAFVYDITIRLELVDDTEFVSLVNILSKIDVDDWNNRYTVDINRVVRLMCYKDVMRVLKMNVMVSTMTKGRIKRAFCSSLINPDSRVFDHFFDTYLIGSSAYKIDPTLIRVADKPNIRSLFKLIRHLSATPDTQVTYRFTQYDKTVQKLALLGALKHRNIVHALKLNDSGGMAKLIRYDHLADNVITCLKSKLPNVLADLVLQYVGANAPHAPPHPREVF